MSPKARRTIAAAANRARKPGSSNFAGGFFSNFGALALAPAEGSFDQVAPQFDGAAEAFAKPNLVLVPPPESVVTEALTRWEVKLAGQYGIGPLDDIRILGANLLELTTAHPTGSAQLFAKRVTRLSSLFRDERSLRHACEQAELVVNYMERHAAQHGICTLYIASGVATWYESPSVVDAGAAASGNGKVSDGEINTLAEVATGSVSAVSGVNTVPTAVVEPKATHQLRMPVLLQPVTLELRGNGEYELNLEGAPEINPVLAAKIRAAGGLLDAEALALTATTAAGFTPQDALNRIEALGSAVLNRFELVRRCVVGVFAHQGQVAAADVAQLGPLLEANPLVKALAGDDAAAASLAVMVPTAQTTLGNTGAGDLNPTEQQVLAVANTGKSLFLNAPVGSEPEAAITAIMADAAAQGKSVLHISSQRRVGVGLKRRLTELGLENLVLEVPATPAWKSDVARRLLSSMTQEFGADGEFANTDEYVGVCTQLETYLSGLHRTREPWGVSINQAFHQVAALTAAGAQTTVQFSHSVMRSLSDEVRTRLGNELTLAAQTGAFSPAIVNSPWYGAKVADHSHALAAHNRVNRLAQTSIPQLLERIAYISEYCGLGVATTLNEFGELLTMLGGMRSTLDIFLPQVFEHSVANLIVATSARKDRCEKENSPGALATRRLRKYARDLVRPGVRVYDLSAELIKVEAQREVWAQYANRPSYPVLPSGLVAIEELYEAVQLDLAALEGIIGSGAYASDIGVAVALADRPLLELASYINALAADTSALENLPARERALHQLRRNGLGALMADLAERQVPLELVSAEFDLAWWGSLLQLLLENEPVVAQTSAKRLTALTNRFRELDAAYAEASGVPVSAAVHARVEAALATENMASLYSALVGEPAPALRDLMAQFGSEVQALRPVLMATPSLVSHLLPATTCFDLVVLDRVQSEDVPTLLPAIGRAKQVVAIGDPLCATGYAVTALAKVLPQMMLPARGTRRDAAITKLLANHGYSGILRGAPLPRAAAPIQFEQVDGRGVGANDSAIIEAPEAEVTRAVELAIEHARYRPAESLAIITLTRAHAEAIENGLAAAIDADRSLIGYFGAHQPEPMVISAADSLAGLRRDAVIFTLGLGRTVHGRVLHSFGPVSTEQGPALLNAALGVTRKRLQVLSSFGAEDLETERITGEGAAYLRELLALAGGDSGGLARSKNLCRGLQSSDDSPLLVEVGQRLQIRGYMVEYSFGCRGGNRIPMVVGHPAIPQEWLVAVLDDGAKYAGEPSLRLRDRHQPAELISLGWAVTQVWSVAAFLDPDAEAERISALVEEALVERLSARTETAPVPVVEFVAATVPIVAPPAEYAPVLELGAAGGLATVAEPEMVSDLELASELEAAPELEFGLELEDRLELEVGANANPVDATNNSVPLIEALEAWLGNESEFSDYIAPVAVAP